MLFKRGSTISAAEGGCQAEVGGMLSDVDCYYFSWCSKIVLLPVACSMASAGFAACMGGEHSFSYKITETPDLFFLFQHLQRLYFRFVT
jgi:hypothetical protein